jgi:hypothetical protein
VTRTRRPGRWSHALGIALFVAGIIGLILCLLPFPCDPSRVVHTANPVDMVAACLSQRPGTEIEALSGGRKRVRVNNGRRGTLETFTLIPEGTGSIVEDRHVALILGGPLSLDTCAPPRA